MVCTKMELEDNEDLKSSTEEQVQPRGNSLQELKKYWMSGETWEMLKVQTTRFQL